MEKDIGRGLIGHGSETPKANQSFSCSSDLGTLQQRRGGLAQSKTFRPYRPTKEQALFG